MFQALSNWLKDTRPFQALDEPTSRNPACPFDDWVIWIDLKIATEYNWTMRNFFLVSPARISLRQDMHVAKQDDSCQWSGTQRPGFWKLISPNWDFASIVKKVISYLSLTPRGWKRGNHNQSLIDCLCIADDWLQCAIWTDAEIISRSKLAIKLGHEIPAVCHL